MRYADRSTRERKLVKSPKPYQFPMFTDVLAGDDDDREENKTPIEGFNLLKQGTNSEDIWTAEELDTALTKKNEQLI